MRTGDFTRYARQLLAPLIQQGVTCPRCGGPIWPGQDWDVGHTVDLVRDPHQSHTRAGVRAAIREGMLRPEHRGCNRAAGARLGNQLRKRNPSRPKPKPRPARPLPPPSRPW